MPIDPEALSALAAEYAGHMTSIRGRRVRRLLQREFAGAEHAVRVQVGVVEAFLGLSASGAAVCVTDGRGRQASVVKWRRGSREALACHFDLLKDSLPLLGTTCVRVDGLLREALLSVAADLHPAPVRRMAADAIRALPRRAP